MADGSYFNYWYWYWSSNCQPSAHPALLELQHAVQLCLQAVDAPHQLSRQCLTLCLQLRLTRCCLVLQAADVLILVQPQLQGGTQRDVAVLVKWGRCCGISCAGYCRQRSHLQHISSCTRVLLQQLQLLLLLLVWRVLLQLILLQNSSSITVGRASLPLLLLWRQLYSDVMQH